MRNWLARWTGAACAVAGCMPMLAALVGGMAGASTGMAMGMMAPATPGWITALGSLSWPLLVVSAALLVWSFHRTSPRARTVAYAGVALLVVNQLSMTLWLFLPAMALVAIAFALARAGSGAAATR